jgi:hypothetical protein
VPTKITLDAYAASHRAVAESISAAGVTISGIELTEKIGKGQFKIGKLGGSKATMPEIWRAELAS